jgi:hypothetical protein
MGGLRNKTKTKIMSQHALKKVKLDSMNEDANWPLVVGGDGEFAKLHDLRDWVGGSLIELRYGMHSSLDRVV